MATSQVILIEAVPSLGAEADVVKVRSGYARNFLIPFGKAIEATSVSLHKMNHLKTKRAEREGRELIEAEALASKINKLRLSVSLETGLEGKAFGSITAHDLLELVHAELEGILLPRHAIVLERPLKETGEKTVPVRLHPDVTATLRIKITSAFSVEDAENAQGEKKTSKAKTSSPRKTEEV
ncbi:MAG: 50S ribosomal protein L9 [Chthoniobacterales bacterium]|nr:50S ribosomal protein L9 [Chthoniobacterales bacterium]